MAQRASKIFWPLSRSARVGTGFTADLFPGFSLPGLWARATVAAKLNEMTSSRFVQRSRKRMGNSPERSQSLVVALVHPATMDFASAHSIEDLGGDLRHLSERERFALVENGRRVAERLGPDLVTPAAGRDLQVI